MSENGKFDLLITNGDVVLPDGVVRVDVGVRGEKIVALVPDLPQDAHTVIDAAGKLVFPGFIDPHTHMGIPIKDTTSADDFASGTEAAAFGGVTTILDFTVQASGQSLHEATGERVAKAQGKSCVDYGIHVNVTDKPTERLDEIPELIDAGFTSFKTFSTYREAGMMIEWDEFRQVMAQVHAHGGLVMLHAEDNEIIESRTAEYAPAGYEAPIYHPRSRPPDAEAKAISDASAIAGELDATLYIVHLSSKAGLEAGLQARARGVDIILETCPQYLVLTEEKYLQENGHYFITTPALRTDEDREALWEALAKGQINTVGTDHCPFTVAQKESANGVFHRTPNGLPGVETMFPLLYTYGVAEGRIRLEQLVQLLARNAAHVFGIADRKGEIRVGADADLVIWDPEVETTLTAAALHGNADWSPYEGMAVAGKLAYTILRGRVLVQDDRLLGKPGSGELLPARPKNE